MKQNLTKFNVQGPSTSNSIPKRIFPAQPLDLLEAACQFRFAPLCYCHLTLDGPIDIARLHEALYRSSQYVPELLCSFDFIHGYFADIGLTTAHAIRVRKDRLPNSWLFNLHQEPQLKISIYPENGQVNIMIAMSHILSDGIGFLQYLYLLSALYCHKQLPQTLQNHRSIVPILDKIHIRHATEQERYGHKFTLNSLCSFSDRSNEMNAYCPYEIISSRDLKAVTAKAKHYGATLNDVFLTSFARVIARLQQINTVVLPCSANLRRFHPSHDELSIANMAGRYRITIEIQPSQSFDDTLIQVHLEMHLQKSRCRCFAGIPLLHTISGRLPEFMVNQLCKKYYYIPSISYTNVGVIDRQKLHFDNCQIKHCFITGAYRTASDFQLSVSTFQDTSTLACALYGTHAAYMNGLHLLALMKQELLDWITET